MGEVRPAAVIGDIHGESKLLRQLIDKIRNKFGQEIDLYCTGDLIDRGPGSKEVIQICIDEGVKAQIGNHEQWIQDLVVNQLYNDYCQQDIMGGKSTIISYGVDFYSDGKNFFPSGRHPKNIGQELFDAIPDSHKDWIRTLPSYRFITVGSQKYCLIHAGLTISVASGQKDASSDEELMSEVAKYSVDNILWPSPRFGALGRGDNLYHFKDTIQIFGHRPVKEPIFKEHFIAIDTGCGTCSPHTLSAVILPSNEVIQASHN